MSIYRLLRTSALLAVARRYRQKLFGLAIAVSVALVTSWLYSDIASYLDAQHPQFVLAALITKTLIVYGVLVYVFWSIRPDAWISAPERQSASADAATPSAPIPTSGPLDELLDKPRLKSRKEALLAGNEQHQSD